MKKSVRAKYRLVLWGALLGVFAAYCARSIRLLAWAWGGEDVPGVVLVEGLISDFAGAFDPRHAMVGTGHMVFGALVGLSVLAWPKHLLLTCLIGLAAEITLLAILTPVEALPNTNLDPLGAIAIAAFWLLLGIASFAAARRHERRPTHATERETFSIHCTAH